MPIVERLLFAVGAVLLIVGAMTVTHIDRGLIDPAAVRAAHAWIGWLLSALM